MVQKKEKDTNIGSFPYSLGKSILLSFPQNVPRSNIVFDETLSLQEKANQLIDKYVRSGSMFELNVGDQSRTEVVNLLAHWNELGNGAVALFTNVALDCFETMEDSWERFTKTTEYEKWVNEMI